LKNKKQNAHLFHPKKEQKNEEEGKNAHLNLAEKAQRNFLCMVI
jgi:hypothetical protein